MVWVGGIEPPPPRSKRGSLPVSYTQETGAHEGDRTLLHPLDRRRLSPESDVRNGSAATTALWSYAVATAARRSSARLVGLLGVEPRPGRLRAGNAAITPQTRVGRPPQICTAIPR